MKAQSDEDRHGSRTGGGGLVSVRLVFVKQISISRCERALYKLEVDDLQNVKVSLVNVATARLCDCGDGAVNLELLFTCHEEIALH